MSIERQLAQKVSTILLSLSAHGHATSSLGGLGEISLRDGAVAAVAAVAARQRRAWVIRRELRPPAWRGANVDLVVQRRVAGTLKWVAAMELKWWRQSDDSNASNRRRDLVRDFVRAASIYPTVEETSLVCLLARSKSWTDTITTSGKDKIVTPLIVATASTKWDLASLVQAPCVRGALRSASQSVPVPNRFTTELVAEAQVILAGKEIAAARVWSVRKHRNTRVLSPDEVVALLDGPS